MSVDRSEQVIRRFTDGVRKIHVIPRFTYQPDKPRQPIVDTDYAYSFEMGKGEAPHFKAWPIPSSVIIKPGPYAMYVLETQSAANPSMPGELQSARLVLVQGGDRSEDMSIDPKTGNLLVWVHKNFRETDEKYLNFYAVDPLPDLNLAALTKTLNNNLDNHFLRGATMPQPGDLK